MHDHRSPSLAIASCTISTSAGCASPGRSISSVAASPGTCSNRVAAPGARAARRRGCGPGSSRRTSLAIVGAADQHRRVRLLDGERADDRRVGHQPRPPRAAPHAPPRRPECTSARNAAATTSAAVSDKRHRVDEQLGRRRAWRSRGVVSGQTRRAASRRSRPARVALIGCVVEARPAPTIRMTVSLMRVPPRLIGTAASAVTDRTTGCLPANQRRSGSQPAMAASHVGSTVPTVPTGRPPRPGHRSTGPCSHGGRPVGGGRDASAPRTRAPWPRPGVRST